MRDNVPSPLVSFHPAATARAIAFGPFRFDVRDRTLSRDGREIRLPPRALSILEYLLERPGRVVPKQELIDTVWKDAFVSESSLTEAVGVLRQVLGDTASGAVYIQTVHRRGYRFVAPVAIDAHAAAALTSVDTPAAAATDTAPAAPAPPAAPEEVRPRARKAVALVIAALAVLAAGAYGYYRFSRLPAPRVTRTTITLPDGQAPAPALSARTVAALSPDGRRVVYVAGSAGNYRLFLRAIDQFDAVPIPGTEGGHGPFFSPDGLSVGFFRDRHLLVLRLPDGQPLDLGASGASLGGWWHTDDTILFATGSSDGIRRVAAQGGTSTPVPVGALNPADLRHPSLTADGRTMLATHWKQTVRNSEVVAIDLGTGASRRIGSGVHARPVSNSHAVFLHDNNLVAASLTTSGDEVPLLTGVMTGLLGAGQYSLAADGTLLYLPHLPSRMLRQLTLLKPDGSVAALPFEQRAFQNIAVSPDGNALLATIYDQGAADLWAGDMARGTLTRLTSGEGVVDPVWSQDGREVLFGSARSGAYRIYRMAVDASSPASVVSSLTGVSPASVGGGVLLAHRVNPGGDADLLRIMADGSWEPWLATRTSEGWARIAPDGRWVVYAGNASGRPEVYRRHLSGGPSQQISTEGGEQPHWSPEGRYVYFINRMGLFRVDTAGAIAGPPELIHDAAEMIMARPSPRGLVLVTALEETRPITAINVVGNWLAEVTPRLPR